MNKVLKLSRSYCVLMLILLAGKFVEEAHFGGGMLTKNSKDRESLIDELINESKKRKAERQRNKEETLEATEQLDEEWKTLGTIVTAPKDTDDLANSQKKDEYDVVMRQLKFEPQGQVIVVNISLLLNKY